jgi:molybdopterin converting factor small subunit
VHKDCICGRHFRDRKARGDEGPCHNSVEVSEVAVLEQVAQEQEVSMPVTFQIPRALREFTGGEGAVSIAEAPATVGEALSMLWTRYPGIRDRVATEQGQVRQHINIFVGDENARYTGGLATPVEDGATISIVPAVSGGV